MHTSSPTQPAPARGPLPLRARLVPAALSGALGGAGLAMLPLRADETWWYVAVGRLIARFGAVPDANHIAYSTPADAPSLIIEWGAALLMAWIERGAGLEGLLTARNMLFALALFIVSLALPATLGPVKRVVFPLCGALLAGVVTFATPPIFAAPLFALAWLAVAIGLNTRRRALQLAAPLAMLPLAVLWANLDVAYGMLTPVALWAAAAHVLHHEPSPDPVSSATPRWQLPTLWALGGLLVPIAALLNPRGAALLTHTLDVLRLYPGHPDAPLWSFVTPQTHPFALALTALGVAAVFLGAWRSDGLRRHAPELGLTVVLAAIGLSHLRALMWFALSLPLLLSLTWPDVMRSAASSSRLTTWLSLATRPVIALMFALSALLLVLPQPSLAPRAWLLSPLSETFELRATAPHRTALRANVPVEAGELIARATRPPRVWASRRHEPYVLYKLVDKTHQGVTFTDLRHEMISAQTRELRELVATTPDLWRGVFQNHGVTAALLHKGDDPALVEALRAHRDWHVVEEDTHNAYFVRVVSDRVRMTPP